MANDLNQCNFIGRLGRDPETRYAPNGEAICNFSIACGWKTREKEGTEWVSEVRT
ncbi:MAG: single-stranded DNA-binding protein [Methyloversatilis discipulorum]|uniref:single-stranded DNA-binding protein n=1 Tax=Methyloversatilis discipulorum TaxID=1119528 RepID=UPI0027F49CD8|nr:single-stranded DNA-binding protein [Methyloversatilis discipulorum]